MLRSSVSGSKAARFARGQSTQMLVQAQRWQSQMQKEQKPSPASTRQYPKVNQAYQHQYLEMPTLEPKNNQSGMKYSSMHDSDKTWDHDTVLQTLQTNSMFTWGAKDPMLSSALHITHGEGCYLYDHTGKKYIDWSSQAICTNLGHTMPAEIRDGITEQIAQVSHLYGGLAYHEVRAKLCGLMADVVPGDINSFLFPSSGAEANEGAIRIARKYTGRFKVLSRYRSYHGGTMGSLSLTGDCRTHETVAQTSGFVKMFDPTPTYFDWAGADADAMADSALAALHEQIKHEGPGNIAGIWMEPITGTNGWVKPPLRYMQGVRALCDKYGILLVFDEVMAGFGRTGKLFAFEHFDGVLPDIVTFAKGITGAYLPMSGIGVRDPIMKHFSNTPLGYGSTYQAHPVSMAAGYATVKYLIDNEVVQHVAALEPYMMERMNHLVNDTKCKDYIKQARVNGFGCALDIADPNTNDIICSFNEVDPRMTKLRQKFFENGLITMCRGPIVHCTPPLIATEEDLDHGFKILEKAIPLAFE